MATSICIPWKTWKAVVRKRGWPATIKTFRTRRDSSPSFSAFRNTLL
ncbi:MAG: hypothetical protein AAGI72_01195 [Pseudomonadota bacterium]